MYSIWFKPPLMGKAMELKIENSLSQAQEIWELLSKGGCEMLSTKP